MNHTRELIEQASAEITFEQAEALLRRMAAVDDATISAPAVPRGATDPNLVGQAFQLGSASVTGWKPAPPSQSRAPAAEAATLLPTVADRHIPVWDEQALRAILESVPDAVVAIDAAGSIVLVNERTEELFGYPRSELLAHPIEMLMPERFRARHVGQREQYFAAPKRRPMGEKLDLWGRHRSGREFPVEISLSPMRAGDGLLVTATVRDISERRQAELQLRHAEARYRTLVEEIPAVTFMASLEETPSQASELYVSPQIESLLGFTQRQWLEDPVLWYRQLHPDDRDRWHQEFARTCSTGMPFDSVYRFLARDGRVVWVHGYAKLVRDRDGLPLFLQGVAFDITARKQAEETMAQVHETLARRVAEAVADAEARSHELAKSNEALDRFAYIASHDLREPLRTMLRYVQLLERQYATVLDGQALEYVSKTIAGARQMNQLISDLHTHSRIGRAGEYLTVNTADALAEACANLRAALEESGSLVSAGPLPAVRGVRPELVLLFQNLLENAIKFRREQAASVAIGARLEQDHWLFWVEDNGIGIEPQYLERIFGIGERLHGRKIPGTGFGLANCRKIVERHGGRIWAESQPGAGSKFLFTLPAA